MKIAVVDYGMGNLASVQRAFAKLGASPFIARKPEELGQAARIVLPGVGSFAEGMVNLRQGGWVEAIRDQVLTHGKPLLGICLGMQLLGELGTEGGETPGLGLISGRITHMTRLGCELRIPHVGWNAIERTQTGSRPKLLSGIPDHTDFYFVHSYVFEPEDPAHLLAQCEYGLPLAAVIGKDQVFGTQFHPEKSSKAGFRLLQNFMDSAPC
jgi:imidazole glycerol-phosphate synthase subunit HisH